VTARPFTPNSPFFQSTGSNSTPPPSSMPKSCRTLEWGPPQSGGTDTPTGDRGSDPLRTAIPHAAQFRYAPLPPYANHAHINHQPVFVGWSLERSDDPPSPIRQKLIYAFGAIRSSLFGTPAGLRRARRSRNNDAPRSCVDFASARRPPTGLCDPTPGEPRHLSGGAPGMFTTHSRPIAGHATECLRAGLISPGLSCSHQPFL
jgi:hypothetical protein